MLKLRFYTKNYIRYEKGYHTRYTRLNICRDDLVGDDIDNMWSDDCFDRGFDSSAWLLNHNIEVIERKRR